MYFSWLRATRQRVGYAELSIIAPIDPSGVFVYILRGAGMPRIVRPFFMAILKASTMARR